MQFVRRYYQSPSGKLIADKLSIKVFGLGDKFDLVGNCSGSCDL
jgi:hypothetical protein